MQDRAEEVKQVLTTQIKRRITYAILMAVFAAAARYMVDYFFPEDEMAV